MEAKDEIKNRLSVEDVVGEYLELKPSGRNLRALSPFTAEKTPSFMVSPEKQIWHDFSSNKGGDIFSFVMIMEGVDFVESIKILARKAGVDLSQYNQGGSNAKQKERLIEANQLAANFYQRQLIKHKPSLDYLKNRGYTKQTIIDFKLGWAPDSFDSLLNFLTKKGFKQEELIKAGLVTSRNNKTYDIFRGRVTVPLVEPQGRVVGFTARILKDIPNAPKYLNTPQTLIYDKSKLLFGLNLAKDSIRQINQAIVVEGNMDVVASHQVQVSNVVASSGTALTISHIKQLERLSRNIALAFDADQAGLDATERAIFLTQGRKINLTVIELRQGKDPDELIKNDPNAWKMLAKNPKPAIDWLIRHYSQQLDITQVSGKREFSDKMAQILSKLTDEVEADHYVSQIAKLLKVSNEAVMRKVNNTQQPVKRYKKPKNDIQQTSQATSATSQAIIDEMLLMALISRSTTELVEPYAKHFTAPQTALFSYLNGHKTNPKSPKLPKVLREYSEYVNIQMFKIEELYDQVDAERAMEMAQKAQGRLDNILKKQKIEPLYQQLKEAEASNDSTKVVELTKQIAKLHKT